MLPQGGRTVEESIVNIDNKFNIMSNCGLHMHKHTYLSQSQGVNKWFKLFSCNAKTNYSTVELLIHMYDGEASNNKQCLISFKSRNENNIATYWSTAIYVLPLNELAASTTKIPFRLLKYNDGLVEMYVQFISSWSTLIFTPIVCAADNIDGTFKYTASGIANVDFPIYDSYPTTNVVSTCISKYFKVPEIQN